MRPIIAPETFPFTIIADIKFARIADLTVKSQLEIPEAPTALVTPPARLIADPARRPKA